MPYQWVMIIPAEITPAVSVLRFWPETEVVPLAAYITIFLVAIALPNVFHVRIYGHIEYYMSFVKCLAVVAMIFFMFVMTSKIFVVNSSLRAVLCDRNQTSNISSTTFNTSPVEVVSLLRLPCPRLSDPSAMVRDHLNLTKAPLSPASPCAGRYTVM